MTVKPLESYSREELIETIKSLRVRKKYGLVWEDKPERVAEECKKKLPVISEITDKAINLITDEPTNFIIEGDNYHALSVLNYTHAGKIDVIYIDPPYNTGANNWRYNNAFVDAQDTFRHSKWLSWMKKRLELAKPLLKDTGIICITIDDYESATLRLLADEVFGQDNYLGTIVIRNNPSGRSTVKGLSINHEYALFYQRTSSSAIGRMPHTDSQKNRYSEKDENGYFEWENFRKNGTDSNRADRPKQFFPLFYSAKNNFIRIPDVKWDNEKRSYDVLEQTTGDEVELWPITADGVERVWKYGIDHAREDASSLMVKQRNGKMEVYRKKYLSQGGSLPRTWWEKPEYSARDNGTRELTNILKIARYFDFPKAPEAVKDCLRVANAKKDAIILDFFAGSGTTGQAVLELNKEDGGHRQFILCTNNENKIAEEVTYPRVKTVITGKREDGSKYSGGIPANLRYFKTTFIDKSSTLDRLRRELSPACEDMIRIREDAYEKNIDEDMFKVFKNKRGLTAIIYNRFELDGYIAKLEELETETPVHLYVFSYDKDGRADQIPKATKHQYESQPIPEGVLEVYKRIFR